MSGFGLAARPVVVGHRGGRGEGWPPENTLASFERARREGAHAVELDVRTCATGEAIVFHDTHMTRMTGGVDLRSVARINLRELLTIDLGGRQERAPTLASALAWAGGAGMPLNVEIKHDVPNRWALVEAVARDLASARTPIVVSSFDPFILAATAICMPRVPRALLTHARQRSARALRALSRSRWLFALHVERTEISARGVLAWKRRGLRVGVWTVNEPEEARELVRLGVDTIITDAPGRIVAALSRTAPA